MAASSLSVCLNLVVVLTYFFLAVYAIQFCHSFVSDLLFCKFYLPSQWTTDFLERIIHACCCCCNTTASTKQRLSPKKGKRKLRQCIKERRKEKVKDLSLDLWLQLLLYFEAQLVNKPGKHIQCQVITVIVSCKEWRQLLWVSVSWVIFWIIGN